MRSHVSSGPREAVSHQAPDAQCQVGWWRTAEIAQGAAAATRTMSISTVRHLSLTLLGTRHALSVPAASPRLPPCTSQPPATCIARPPTTNRLPPGRPGSPPMCGKCTLPVALPTTLPSPSVSCPVHPTRTSKS